MDNMTDILVLILGIILGAFCIIALLIKFFTQIYIPFVSERDYIKMEISRSYGDAYSYWEKELKKLYVSNIPFIGKRLAKKVKRK